MSAAGVMRDFDRCRGQEEYLYPRQDNRNRGGQKTETCMSVSDVFSDLVQRQREELEERIRTGTSEPSYPLGANSFTEREWTKLIRSVDAVQEEMRETAERERELEKEEEKIEKAESLKSSMIVYDVDGIRCIESVSGICQWFTRFTDKGQYSLVQSIMEEVETGENPAPVFQEDFWNSLF